MKSIVSMFIAAAAVTLLTSALSFAQGSCCASSACCKDASCCLATASGCKGGACCPDGAKCCVSSKAKNVAAAGKAGKASKGRTAGSTMACKMCAKKAA